MKVAFVTIYDIARAFGGVSLFATHALEDQDVTLQKIQVPPRWTAWRRIKESFNARLLKREYSITRDPAVLREMGQTIDQRLDSDVDAILSPMSPGSQPITYVRTRKPVVIWTDTTLAQAVDMYPELKRLGRKSIAAGLRNERRALERCDRVMYSSHWAAKAAIDIYGLDPAKVGIVPFGPAIEPPTNARVVEALLRRREPHCCRLLSIASSWTRKRMDIAIAIASMVNHCQLPCSLTVVGAKPPGSSALPQFVNAIGRIDKQTPTGRRMMRRLMGLSHFMILPTGADLTPIAFSEANSFALPVLTTNVGGISTIIHDNINGHKFDINARNEEYSRYIIHVMSQRGRYHELATGTYYHYIRHLSWNVIASALVDAIRQVTKESSPA